ncbi:MAG: ATP-binding protein [Cyanobacteria bacterium]|nr:ATP-binding protein [Cyanobacteriota bacterium]
MNTILFGAKKAPVKQLPNTALKIKEKTVWMPIGIPGCGKTTYLRNAAGTTPFQIISPDLIREELTGNMGDLSQDKKVWPLAEERFKEALASKAPQNKLILLDATFLQPRGRKKFIDLMKESSQKVMLKIFEFQASLATCLERQKGRERQVPPEVMARLANGRVPFSTEEAEGLKTEVLQIPETFTLTNPTQQVSVEDVKSVEALETRLKSLGFWKEGNSWCSAKVSQIEFAPAQLGEGSVLKQIAEKFIAQGFATQKLKS